MVLKLQQLKTSKEPIFDCLKITDGELNVVINSCWSPYVTLTCRVAYCDKIRYHHVPPKVIGGFNIEWISTIESKNEQGTKNVTFLLSV